MEKEKSKLCEKNIVTYEEILITFIVLLFNSLVSGNFDINIVIRNGKKLSVSYDYDIILQTDYQKQCKEVIRIQGSSFQQLLDIVLARILENDTIFQKAIPTEKHVAIALSRLAADNSYRTINSSFNCQRFLYGH